MDIFAVVGMFLGVTFILVGQAMEGGNLGQLLQITAAFIVFGGTAGAVVLSFPPNVLKKAIMLIKDIFISVISKISKFSNIIIIYSTFFNFKHLIKLEQIFKIFSV